jgi:hypothetical protein
MHCHARDFEIVLGTQCCGTVAGAASFFDQFCSYFSMCYGYIRTKDVKIGPIYYSPFSGAASF